MGKIPSWARGFKWGALNADPRASRMDAAPSEFFARQLEFIRARSYDIKYAELKGRMLCPVDNSVDTGAEEVTYRQFDRVGVAKIVHNYATDFPRADVLGKEFHQPIKSLGDAYGYNIQEARNAVFAQRPLEQRKADAARKAIEDLIDKIAALGDSDNGLLGILSLTNTNTYAVPNGAGGSPAWADKTPLEILKDLNGVVTAIITATIEVEKPDTLIMPIAQYRIITTTPLFTVGGANLTIAQFFLANDPYIKQIVPWDKARGAGAGATDRMVVYRRDIDAFCLIIPQEFEQFPPVVNGVNIKVECHARCGGLQVFYPLSFCYADGI